MANCRILEAPGATDSKVLGLLWLHCSATALHCQRKRRWRRRICGCTLYFDRPASQGAQLHAMLQCQCQCPPPFDQRRLHDKDVLALSLQQQSFYLLNRRLGTERRRPRPAKFSLCISRFLGASILQRLLILLDFTSSRTYPLHRPHLCYALSTGALLISDAPLYLSVNYCGLRAVFDHVPIRSLGP